jgi:UDP-3-O-[3-hydroxymyristoyl] glucosamine N-acyltransferase
MRLADLARHLGGSVVGDPDVLVEGIGTLADAGPHQLSFLHNPKYEDQARQSAAGAILVNDAELLPGRNLLVCDEPYLALARALELIHPAEEADRGVHPSAVVDDSAKLGQDVSVGPSAVIGRGAVIGDRTVIGAGVVIGRHVEIGDECELHPNVVVEDRCRVGHRCILHAGTVVGSDGFGFATVDGVHHKVPQVGIVEIEDDVEIGANVCIDRAALGVTRVGRGTKVDNLVQIAHNVEVGEGCLVVAQVGISGSTTIGHHSVFAGQAGLAGHLSIGDRVMIGAKSAVYKDVPAGETWTGIPARPHREWLRSNANLQRLEVLRGRLKMLEREVAALSSQKGDGEE